MQEVLPAGQGTRARPDRLATSTWSSRCPIWTPTNLSGSWLAMVRRHDMLRAVVGPSGQRVAPTPPPWSLDVHDLRASSHDELAAHLGRVRDELSHRRYPAGEWPPFAVAATLRPDMPGLVHLSVDLTITDLAMVWPR